MSKKVTAILKIQFLVLALSILAAGPLQAKPTKSKNIQEAETTVTVGDQVIRVSAPGDLKRVDGRNKIADEFILSLEEKFKLRVLAVYADPKIWSGFVTNLEAQKPASVPRLAIIAVPIKMAEKSFDDKSVKSERRRYGNWFALAANNPPLTSIMNKKGNKKLLDKIGVDLGFKFKTGDDTKKFDETDNSVSFGARLSFNLFGQSSDVYLTATSMRIGQKIVFLAYAEDNGPPEKLTTVKDNTLAWRDSLWTLN